MQVQVYLFFAGRCEEAVEFYKRSIGAQAEMLMRFKETPEPPQPGMIPPGSENKIMHTSFRVGDATVMASMAVAKVERNSRVFLYHSPWTMRVRRIGCSLL